MFEGIKKVLDEFETTLNKLQTSSDNATPEEESIVLHFNMHLAEAIMQESYASSEKVAQIILAEKGMLKGVNIVSQKGEFYC